MTIVWRDEMTVGNETIDNDHKYLISIINLIEAGVNSEVGPKVLLDYMDILIEYSKYHFEREQRLQTKIQYPNSDRHKELHEDLIHRIREVKHDLSATKDSSACEKLTSGLFSLLKDWLLDHVLEEDLKMKPYFEQFGGLI